MRSVLGGEVQGLGSGRRRQVASIVIENAIDPGGLHPPRSDVPSRPATPSRARRTGGGPGAGPESQWRNSCDGNLLHRRPRARATLPPLMSLSVPLRRFVASLLFVVYATFSVLGSALVQCQEADGTVGIEWRGAGCCTSQVNPGSSAGPAAATPSERGENCDGCSDRALADTLSSAATHNSGAAAVKAPDMPAPSAAVLAQEQPRFFASPERLAREMRAPHPPPGLATIRTVVRLV